MNRQLDQMYWKRYYTAETVAQVEALKQDMYIDSTGVRIHMDVYEQKDRNAPVLIFNHGGGGYSRVFAPLALAMYARGYTVVLPDQYGQGYSDGDRGDFTLGQCVQNIVDAARWARARYSGRLFLAGGSVGGGLAYKAAAGAPCDAVICHNLYNFGSARDSLAVSRFAFASDLPLLPGIFAASTRMMASLLPALKLPFMLLGKFESMVDERDTRFFGIWRDDPLPIKAVSLRYMASTFSTPPAVPYQKNTKRVLVINQKRDKMVSPQVTRRNYERLGGDKQYIEIDYGHWATGEQFISEYVEILDQYMRKEQ
ncbi:MAG: alpha/beta fold hydrolase [Chloroflexota bacterium]|nr:alpha/beta fold hydrolase [Chloroflexota bacterium]